jgi:hypothetical protein
MADDSDAIFVGVANPQQRESHQATAGRGEGIGLVVGEAAFGVGAQHLTLKRQRFHFRVVKPAWQR